MGAVGSQGGAREGAPRFAGAVGGKAVRGVARWAVSERASFEEASRWADLVSENRGDSIAVGKHSETCSSTFVQVIVCNKTDIPQVIPDEEGILLADRLNATFSKHSSKLGIGTEGLLKGLARKLGQLTPKGEMTTIDLDLPEPNKTKRCC